MKKLIIVAVIAFLLGFAAKAIADGTYLSAQTIFNKVFNSTSNTLTIKGV